ncbi:YqiA/YcfP family alpha/beta fold hydrolase [Microbulbifer guangxiensis]|uniref:YqiA/YcfP family alpha/beta fold hydrolase n=1 Tax=Microbulbifer guangxiensis TaxID=2904249 RepID=UPI001F2AF9DF|nr:YqiA/YcfP family alpha/beta fold hydrolase [Microbulbifer guangxiensis]
MSELQNKQRPILVYLHGFLSSPQSFKCQQMRTWLADVHPQVTFYAPHLSPHPGIAIESLTALLDGVVGRDPVGLVGSSMGGFMATVLGERYQLPAVVVNPAVHPARFMPAYLGQVLRPYSGEDREYRLTQSDVDTMRQLEGKLAGPLLGRYWLLAQRGDETLDCREAEAFYREQHQTIEEGGDHSFQGFERYHQAIIDFLFNQQ